MNSQRETYSSFEEFWENANRRLTDFNENQARMIWQAATEQGVGEAVAWDDPIVDPIVSKLYRQFKEWNRRGFTADDVTWCEVRGYVSELLNAHPPKPTGGCVPEGWSFKKQGDSILVQYHENGGFVKGRWIDKQSERFSFEFFDALLATQQPPEQYADK